MSQLAILGLMAIVGWLLWRNLGPSIGRRPPDSVPKRDAKTLEADPNTGVYRPVERD